MIKEHRSISFAQAEANTKENIPTQKSQQRPPTSVKQGSLLNSARGTTAAET